MSRKPPINPRSRHQAGHQLTSVKEEPIHGTGSHDTRPSSLGLANVKEQNYSLKGLNNPSGIEDFVSQLEKQDNVIDVQGNLKKKLVLTYKAPKEPPAQLRNSPPKEKKKKKKKRTRIETKSRGTVTTPPPITVESGTWTTTRTRTASVGTSRLVTRDRDSQKDGVRVREFSTNTSCTHTVSIGTDAGEVPGQEDKEVDVRPTMITRGVCPAPIPPQVPTKPVKRCSVGVSCKPPTMVKSTGTFTETHTKGTRTDIVATSDQMVGVRVSVTDTGCDAIRPKTTDRAVSSVPQYLTKNSSTTDLRSFKDCGVSAKPSKSSKAVGTFLTHRNMAVGTSRTFNKNMNKLDNELQKMRSQREELESMTKKFYESRKPPRPIINKTVINCPCVGALCQAAGAGALCQYCRRELPSRSSGTSRSTRSRSSSSIVSSSTQSSRGRTESGCSSRSRVHSVILSESDDKVERRVRRRSRVHSVVLTEQDKAPEEKGWEVRVRTPSKVYGFAGDS